MIPFTPWKLATIGAGILGLVLSALLMTSYFENRDLLKQRDTYISQINDPNTGFVARLAQARTNEATLKVQLETQRKSFEKKAVEREAVLAATEAKLVAAQRRTREMETRLATFLSTGPQGATLEDRVRDIDARGMEEMVK